MAEAPRDNDGRRCGGAARDAAVRASSPGEPGAGRDPGGVVRQPVVPLLERRGLRGAAARGGCRCGVRVLPYPAAFLLQRHRAAADLRLVPSVVDLSGFDRPGRADPAAAADAPAERVEGVRRVCGGVSGNAPGCDAVLFGGAALVAEGPPADALRAADGELRA